MAQKFVVWTYMNRTSTTEATCKLCLNPLTPTVAIWVQLWSILNVLDLVKPSFVIFDIWALWCSECPDVKNYKWRFNPVWHRMLYSCIPYGNSVHQRVKELIIGGGYTSRLNHHLETQHTVNVLCLYMTTNRWNSRTSDIDLPVRDHVSNTSSLDWTVVNSQWVTRLRTHSPVS